MKVVKKKGENGFLQYDVTASTQEVSQALNQASEQFCMQMGIQPVAGKTPAQVVSERLGIKDLDSVIATQAAEMLIPRALDKQGIVPAFTPDMKANVPLKRGRAYSFTLQVMPKPSYELTDYGPVKFTIGACQFSTTDITISDTNGGSTTFSNKAPCGEQAPNYNQYVVYTYNVEKATTLTFTFGSSSYLPYFFAEACDFIPSCEITYYDVDGSKVLATETVTGNSPLVYNADATAAVTVAAGKKFRGWFDDKTLDALKVAEGTVITQDIKLYAKATEIETVEVGKMFKYDLTKNYFYEEDHEAFTQRG